MYDFIIYKYNNEMNIEFRFSNLLSIHFGILSVHSWKWNLSSWDK